MKVRSLHTKKEDSFCSFWKICIYFILFLKNIYNKLGLRYVQIILFYLRRYWLEYQKEDIVQHVVEICSQHLLNFHHQSIRGSRIIIWTCAFSLCYFGSFPPNRQSYSWDYFPQVVEVMQKVSLYDARKPRRKR